MIRRLMTGLLLGAALAAGGAEQVPAGLREALGRALGVSGTPTIVLEDGAVVPGYLPPRELLARLERGR